MVVGSRRSSLEFVESVAVVAFGAEEAVTAPYKIAMAGDARTCSSLELIGSGDGVCSLGLRYLRYPQLRWS